LSYLFDTCTLSEAKQAQPNPTVIAYLKALPPDNTYISVLTLGELMKGARLLPIGQKRIQIEQWIAGIAFNYAGRILPVTHDVALVWGELLASAQQQGRRIPPVDGLLAATAIRHGMHLITRNTSDFNGTGVMLVNPWAVSL
jgi:toxin FitB